MICPRLPSIAASAVTVIRARSLTMMKSYGTFLAACPDTAIRLMGKNLEVGGSIDRSAIRAEKFLELLDHWTRLASPFHGTACRLVLRGVEIVQKGLVGMFSTGNGADIFSNGRTDRKINMDSPSPSDCFHGLIKCVNAFDTALTSDQHTALK